MRPNDVVRAEGHVLVLAVQACGVRAVRVLKGALAAFRGRRGAEAGRAYAEAGAAG